MKAKQRTDGAPWGKANQSRGREWHDMALAFVKAFPPSQMFTVKAFDAFAEQHGLYKVPKPGPKSSPQWRWLVDRRAEVKNSLNRAGSHPRIISSGEVPFFISVVRNGLTWEIRETHEAYKDKRLLEHMQRAFEPVQVNIEYMLQSMPWEQLPPYEPRFAEMYYQRLIGSKLKLHQEIGEVMAEFAKLEANLRKSLPKETGG